MAFRFCNEPLVVDLPKFVATNPNAFSGAQRNTSDLSAVIGPEVIRDSSLRSE
jgi:hypothetical protein